MKLRLPVATGTEDAEDIPARPVVNCKCNRDTPFEADDPQPGIKSYHLALAPFPSSAARSRPFTRNRINLSTLKPCRGALPVASSDQISSSRQISLGSVGGFDRSAVPFLWSSRCVCAMFCNPLLAVSSAGDHPLRAALTLS